MIHHNDGTSHCPAGDLYQTSIDGQLSCLGKRQNNNSTDLLNLQMSHCSVIDV